MIRLPGIIKVTSVLIIDFLLFYSLFDDMAIAAAITGVIALYVWFGGYTALFKEGGIRFDKLPSYESSRLKAAKAQLINDVKASSSADISGLKLYLVDDDEMQATAYGANCVSVTSGTLKNSDAITLNAVLAHEISHILNLDPEFNRAIFGSVLLICTAIGFLSAASLAVIFIIFLALGFLCSWLGVIMFRGTAKAVRFIFGLFQKIIVVIYLSLMCFSSRHTEYRCDMYSAQLGYGLQLAHFLSFAAPENHRQLTLTEALYRTHPPTPKRIARLEAYAGSNNK